MLRVFIEQSEAHYVKKRYSTKGYSTKGYIPVKIRLAITLRFLAFGDSFENLHYLIKISSCLILRIVLELYAVLDEV